jgi:hypothetical protein
MKIELSDSDNDMLEGSEDTSDDEDGLTMMAASADLHGSS